MKLYDLKYFEDLCKTKSFTQTAKNFFVSQPVISTAIKSLESYFDVNLLEREKFNKNIKITENGHELLGLIKKMNFYEKNLIEKINFRDEKKIIKLGIPPLVKHPNLIKTLRGILKNISGFEKICLVEEEVDKLCDMLSNNKLDLCIVYYLNEKILKKNIIMHKLKSIKFNVFFNENKSLKVDRNGVVDVNNLSDETIICMRKSSPYYYMLNFILKKYKIVPFKIIYVDSLMEIENMISKNIGISFLPEKTIEKSNICESYTSSKYFFDIFIAIKENKNLNSVYIDLLEELIKIIKYGDD